MYKGDLMLFTDSKGCCLKHFKLSVTMLSAVSVLPVFCLVIIGCGENTAGPSDPFDLWYSQQNESIIFLSRAHSSEGELYLLDKSGEITRLTTTAGWQSDHDPSWSPDGGMIVYSHYDGSRPWADIADPSILVEYWDELIPWNVCSVDLQGNSVQLTDVQYVASLPVFSADGGSILFLRMDYLFDSSEILIGAEHLLMLIPESGGSGQQLIPDGDHTGTMEFFDW